MSPEAGAVRSGESFHLSEEDRVVDRKRPKDVTRDALEGTTPKDLLDTLGVLAEARPELVMMSMQSTGGAPIAPELEDRGALAHALRGLALFAVSRAVDVTRGLERIKAARSKGLVPRPASELAAALTWIENNHPDGVALVARALSGSLDVKP